MRLRPVAMAGSSAAFSPAAILPQGTRAVLPIFHLSSNADKATDRNHSWSSHKLFISLSCRQGMEKWSDLLLIHLWLKQELSTVLNLCYLSQVYLVFKALVAVKGAYWNHRNKNSLTKYSHAMWNHTGITYVWPVKESLYLPFSYRKIQNWSRLIVTPPVIYSFVTYGKAKSNSLTFMY